MSINSRIKTVRKKMGMNQTEFASRLGIKQSSLSDIENGKTITIDERNIKIICQQFNVNENWLRSGEGEIFNKLNIGLEELLLSSLDQLDELDKKIISEYIKLNPEQRKAIKEYIKRICKI